MNFLIGDDNQQTETSVQVQLVQNTEGVTNSDGDPAGGNTNTDNNINDPDPGGDSNNSASSGNPGTGIDGNNVALPPEAGASTDEESSSSLSRLQISM